MKKIQNVLEYILVMFLSRIFGILPLNLALALGKGFGLLFYYCIPIRKKVAITNLKNSFPEKDKKEIKRIARQTYENFTCTMVEFIRLPRMTPEYLSRHVKFVHPEFMDQAYKQKKGTLCITGHFGNWEIMAAAIVARGFPMVAVVKEQRNKLVDRLINQHRNKAGVQHLYLGMAIRGVLKALRENKFMALVADQDAHGEGVFVDFLGRPSSTAPGPALFALKTGAPIIFGSAVRGPGGDHTVYLEKIDHSDLHEATEENIKILTQRHATVLEKSIHQWPDHWFWMHKRWKTKPRGIAI